MYRTNPAENATRLLGIAAFLIAALACGSTSSADPEDYTGRLVRIEVSARGYTPGEIEATPGEALHLVFLRRTDEGCGQQLVFPDLDIRRDLPLDTPVAVDVTAPASGRLRFACGMDMLRGAIVVQ